MLLQDSNLTISMSAEKDDPYINAIKNSLTGYSLVNKRGDTYTTNNTPFFMNNIFGNKIVLFDGSDVFDNEMLTTVVTNPVEILSIENMDGTKWKPNGYLLSNVDFYFKSLLLNSTSNVRIDFINIDTDIIYGNLNATNIIQYDGNLGELTLKSWNVSENLPLTIEFIGSSNNSYITSLYNELKDYNINQAAFFIDDTTIENINNFLFNKIVFGDGPELLDSTGVMLPKTATDYELFDLQHKTTNLP